MHSNDGCPVGSGGGGRPAEEGRSATGPQPPATGDQEPRRPPDVVGVRMAAWHPDAGEASPEVAGLAEQVAAMGAAELPAMGLAAGGRPAADVDVLLGTLASVEYELARRMAAAERAGALPVTGAGGMVQARHWSTGYARRLARSGALAARWPQVAGAWAAGVITSEHVDVLARRAAALTEEQMSALLDQLLARWGRLSPEALARFLHRVIRVLAPPPDPEPTEVDAHAQRGLSFSILGDTVLLAGTLPRLEGEVVMHAVEAWADRLRSAADRVPAAARRADGLVALVHSAAAAAPGRGGLPIALTVTLEGTVAGDATWTTSLGHTLTTSEQRFTACTADVTPVVVARRAAQPQGNPGTDGTALHDRLAALATTLLDRTVPLAVGRTARSATPAQRRALAVRDVGCVIPGCAVPAEHCQAHHLHAWQAGGESSTGNLILLCWAHHRQVDLGQWRILPADPAAPVPRPRDGSPPGTLWAANHGAPWVIRAVPRSRWRRSA